MLLSDKMTFMHLFMFLCHFVLSYTLRKKIRKLSLGLYLFKR